MPGTFALAEGGPLPKVLLLSESILMPVEFQPASRNRSKNFNEENMHLEGFKNHDITKVEPPWTTVTTIMMRNLPNKYCQQMLLDEIAKGGFHLQRDFDFIYLPMDRSNGANLGYCFINMVEPARANAFAAAYSGKKMRRFNSFKTVTVMPASIQGYDRNFAYYSSMRISKALDPQYRPLFVRQENRSDPAGQSPVASGSVQASGKGGGSKGQRGGADRRQPLASTPLAQHKNLDSNPGSHNYPNNQSSGASKVCSGCAGQVLPNQRFCVFCGTPVRN